MNILILGMPGAGKGTMSVYLEARFGWKHISTGDMLRTEITKASPLGKQVEAILASGQLVSDALMAEVVTVALKPLKQGFILDGYPRTLAQCTQLQTIVAITKVLYLNISEDIAIQRLLARAQAVAVQRSDDNRQVIIERLKLFNTNHAAILDFYENQGLLTEVVADGSITEVQLLLNNHFA